MGSSVRTAGRWLAPLALMALIFAFSAMPSDDVDRGVVHFLSRKAAHLLEYALLLALWWRALEKKLSDRGAMALALAITVAYACTDELHQRYVEGRIGTPLDVAIDTAGAAMAAGMILRRRQAVRA